MNLHPDYCLECGEPTYSGEHECREEAPPTVHAHPLDNLQEAVRQANAMRPVVEAVMDWQQHVPEGNRQPPIPVRGVIISECSHAWDRMFEQIDKYQKETTDD